MKSTKPEYQPFLDRLETELGSGDPAGMLIWRLELKGGLVSFFRVADAPSGLSAAGRMSCINPERVCMNR